MKSSSNDPLQKEINTVRAMIQMYCKKHHNPKENLCDECFELFQYANKRLHYCQFGKNKPTCNKCPVHCYNTEMREKIRAVMRYAGPRMIYTHPIMGFRHLIRRLKKFDDSSV
ncbi:MAG: nitrous oxide-stimulated promoter family protein [Candidatus Hermodarchaeota archaeon]